MFVYFAQPIDQAREELISERKIRNLMIEAGISYFQPSRAYSLSEDRTGFDTDVLDTINRAALAASDALVAFLPVGVPTLGVPAEIEQALALKKPVVIFTARKLLSISVQIRQWAGRGASIWDVADIEGADIPRQAKALLVHLHTEVEPDAAANEHPPLLVSVDRDTTVPTRAYVGDAGLDLAVSARTTLSPDEYALIPTGVRAAVPHGWWGFMHGRSSSWSKWGLEIRTAVIDSGYRGELMIGVTNRSGQVRVISAGTRLAQYVLMPAFMGDVVETDTLPEHDRGDRGYGSSGL